jgi:nucleoside permease NupC
MISGKSQYKKTDRVLTFSIFSFVNMASSDLTLLLPPERLGEVRRRAISRTPISVLIGGLLSENEGGQLSLRPRPPLKQ